MRVTLLEYTQNADELVAAAARLCYSGEDIQTIRTRVGGKRAQELVAKLLHMGHESPLEHVSFSFGVEGVSRALSHQLVRHRIASYSQQSQRYVSMNNFPYVIPPSIIENEHALKDFQQCMSNILNAYQALSKIVPQEDARYVLPNACETQLVVTMNARSLYNFFNLRCCNRAQWEIRQLARTMLAVVLEVAPAVFSYAGPDCWGDRGCTEGKMTCSNPPTRVGREI
ncbi:MAG: FAD-dependent thymidylate synthase [bacterium]|nr:FAD-dependent thymidylate synthase [bacterium]